MRLIRYEDLESKYGIRWSRVHCDRMTKAGKFVRKVKPGPNTTAYVAEEVESWLAARIAERDGSKAA